MLGSIGQGGRSDHLLCQKYLGDYDEKKCNPYFGFTLLHAFQLCGDDSTKKQQCTSTTRNGNE